VFAPMARNRIAALTGEQSAEQPATAGFIAVNA
jgi:hypothetical protein